MTSWDWQGMWTTLTWFGTAIALTPAVDRMIARWWG